MKPVWVGMGLNCLGVDRMIEKIKKTTTTTTRP